MEGKLEFDYSKLRGRIVEKFGTMQRFGREMNLTKSGISQKMCGRTYFTQPQIFKAAVLLEIPSAEITSYFFTKRVEKTGQE